MPSPSCGSTLPITRHGSSNAAAGSPGVPGRGKRRLVGEHAHERVLLSAGQHLVQRLDLTEGQAQRPGDEALAQHRPVEVDPHPARRRDPAEVGDQAVRDVDEGVGPGLRRSRTGPPGRHRGAVVADQGAHGEGALTERLRADRGVGTRCQDPVGVGLAALEQGQPGAGPAERAADRDDVAGARAGAQHRRPSAQVTQGGHRDDDHAGRRRRQVAADDGCPGLLGERGDAHGRGRRPTRPRARGRRRARRAARSAPHPSRRRRRGSGRRS